MPHNDFLSIESKSGLKGFVRKCEIIAVLDAKDEENSDLLKVEILVTQSAIISYGKSSSDIWKELLNG